MKKKFSMSALVLTGCAAVLCTLVVSIGMVLYRFGGLDYLRSALKVVTVMEIAEERYIGDVTLEELTDGASAGVIDVLDQWSYYMDAESYQSYLLYSQNQYAGIGITISLSEENGELEIVSVTEGGPAEAAGLEAGQVILSVDGTAVAGMTTSEVRALIQARVGDSVEVQVRDANGETQTYQVNCEVLETTVVTSEMLEGNIGYIDIANFEDGCAEDAIAAVDALIAQGAESLIFDVRDNPGGKVSELVEFLDYLLPEGDLFISVNKDGSESVRTSEASCIELPMAVLINANSYSAAEFFAAALEEYDWAETVGEATTGKGRSQVTITLSDGSAVHLSTQKYLTPNRVDLSEAGGLTPDYPVTLSGESDTQLAEAIKILS